MVLVVKIELHSAITGQIKTIATGKIANTGKGTPTKGEYRIELRDALGRLWKTGNIKDFPRKRLLAWDLLACALYSVLGKRNHLVNEAECATETSGKCYPNGEM